ncbi:MAG: hypothetical protein JW747_08595 [Candidatus Aminicenantes bacterium]|nr:hypothetical protein [Candidatus Aminicenantes bacterium]
MSNTLDLFQPDEEAGGASGAFTAEGQILTWNASPPEKAVEQQESLIPAILELTESARLAELPAFEQILIEGSDKKILLLRVQGGGPFLFLMGGKSLDVVSALEKLKRAAEAVGAGLKEPK